MYDFEWHKRHASKTSRSAARILSILREILPFDSLLDVGCGDGLWLRESQALGCTRNKGVDGPWADVKSLLIPTRDFSATDLSGRFAMNERFDLAISLEVAEHVDGAASDTFVDNLVDHADLILFGAAIPFQGGFRHVNEQWQSFWQQKFSDHGYQSFDVIRPLIWEAADVHYWYKQNPLVYVKRTRQDLVDKVCGFMEAREIVGFPINLVCPEKYEAIASYEQIAFKPLLKRFPAKFGAKLRDMVLMRT